MPGLPPPDPTLAHCRQKDCRTRGCGGNRLEAAAGGYKVVWPHHKNEKRWGMRAISFEVPRDVAPVLDAYLEARQLLAVRGCPYLLVTPRGGDKISSSRFSQLWQSILARWGAAASFSPQVGSNGQQHCLQMLC